MGDPRLLVPPSISRADSFDLSTQLLIHDENYSAAHEIFTDLHEQRRANGIYRLGQMYNQGWFVPQNYKRAFELFREAAALGSRGGMNMLGYYYQYAPGDVINIDENKAFEWHLKSAEFGSRNGQFSVAVAYLTGFGVQKDTAKGRYWMQQAADSGDEEANKWLEENLDR